MGIWFIICWILIGIVVTVAAIIEDGYPNIGFLMGIWLIICWIVIGIVATVAAIIEDGWPPLEYCFTILISVIAWPIALQLILDIRAEKKLFAEQRERTRMRRLESKNIIWQKEGF